MKHLGKAISGLAVGTYLLRQRKRAGAERTGRQEAEDGRGRSARKPSEIPAAGWKDILWRTKESLAKDNLSMIAAGVAFYVFFGLVPALAALVAIYGLVADPASIEQQLSSMGGVLPGDVVQLLTEQMKRISESSTGATWGAVLGILLALWGGSRATRGLIIALNIAYGEKETRGFVRLYLISLGLTLAGVVGVIVAVGLIVAIPILLQTVGGGGVAEMVVNLLRWPLLAGFAMVGLAIFYRYAPDRDPAKWRWVTWGAGAATLLWLAVSAGFSFYVSNFGSYNKTYGSLGAVVVMMMWLYISCYVVLLGAELDAEIEHQTARDSTEGPEQPRGQRGAFVADHVGASRENRKN